MATVPRVLTSVVSASIRMMHFVMKNQKVLHTEWEPKLSAALVHSRLWKCLPVWIMPLPVETILCLFYILGRRNKKPWISEEAKRMQWKQQEPETLRGNLHDPQLQPCVFMGNTMRYNTQWETLPVSAHSHTAKEQESFSFLPSCWTQTLL